MKKLVLLILVVGLAGFAQNVNAQCKVLLKSIAGEYEGGCKKGKAEGEGVAKGEDTYKGTFKKGLPSGEGTYTWANGDVYIGEFKKGKKEGAGEMTIKEKETTVKGYWLDDEYIGKDKNPYKVLYKSAFITSTRFARQLGKDEITFVFLSAGKVENKSISLAAVEGSYGNIVSTGRAQLVKSVVYPLHATASFAGQKLEFKINQPGSWKIEVNLK